MLLNVRAPSPQDGMHLGLPRRNTNSLDARRCLSTWKVKTNLRYLRSLNHELGTDLEYSSYSRPIASTSLTYVCFSSTGHRSRHRSGTMRSTSQPTREGSVLRERHYISLMLNRVLESGYSRYMSFVLHRARPIRRRALGSISLNQKQSNFPLVWRR